MEPIRIEQSIQTSDDILFENNVKREYDHLRGVIKPKSVFNSRGLLSLKLEDGNESEVSSKQEDSENKTDEELGIKTEKLEIKTEGVDKEKVFPGISWPSTWEDGSRRSAFQPYRSATVLTNLQRGNIQTKTPQSDTGGYSWFEKAGRGDITENDVNKVHDINAVDIHGYSALMWSAAYGQNNAVLLLLEKGADVHVRGKQLETAMHLAAAGGHQEVIRHLINFGADPDIFDEEGNTPLLYAVHGDHPHAVQELLQEGASMFEPDCYNYAVLKECLQAQFVMENHLICMLTGEPT